MNRLEWKTLDKNFPFVTVVFLLQINLKLYNSIRSELIFPFFAAKIRTENVLNSKVFHVLIRRWIYSAEVGLKLLSAQYLDCKNWRHYNLEMIIKNLISYKFLRFWWIFDTESLSLFKYTTVWRRLMRTRAKICIMLLLKKSTIFSQLFVTNR